ITGMAGVLSYGGYQVISGRLTAGGLVAFYGYTLQLFIPLYGVVDIYAKVQRVAASARRLIEITDAKSILPDGVRPLRVDEPAVVELKDVCFSYDSERSVLNALSLRVDRGERVALTGTSGNGKSTIAKLVARMYDTRTGNVLLDGNDVRDF